MYPSVPAHRAVAIRSAFVSVLHGSLVTGGWLRPWLAVLLISASLAYVINTAVSGSSVTVDVRSEVALASAVAQLSSTSTVAADNVPFPDPACISRVALYGASMSDAFRRCSMELPDTTAP